MDYIAFKSALIRRGLTQLELARKLNWPASRISLILRGYRVAKLDEAKKLSKILGVDVAQLFPAQNLGK